MEGAKIQLFDSLEAILSLLKLHGVNRKRLIVWRAFFIFFPMFILMFVIFCAFLLKNALNL
jgi:hypothetical protein